MTTRDTDLERLMRDLRREDPYIHEPDEKDVDIGGACFLNRDRVCGPDCTAFVSPEAPTAAERCILLSGVERLTELVGELVRVKRPERPMPPDIAPPFLTPPKPGVGGSK